jgi:hypothetical protein
MLSTPPSNVKTRVFVEYRSAAGLLSKDVRRLVFALPHLEYFLVNRTYFVTERSHCLLAAERLIDVATILAFGCVPRPGLLSNASTNYVTFGCLCIRVMSITTSDLVLREKLRLGASFQKDIGRWMVRSKRFSLAKIEALCPSFFDGVGDTYFGITDDSDDVGVNATTATYEPGYEDDMDE